MKKLFFLLVVCFTALTMQGQRCAVLEFKAGVGISQADVDGISAIFITYFRPAGYTMVERTQIDKVIEEQGFQRSAMTQEQMVRVGEILNVSKIVVGDINVVMGQYNVDARVINVETGTISDTEGSTFAKGSSYRSYMQNVAQKLAAKIAIRPGSEVQAKETSTIRGYVDLGLPSGTLWKATNESGIYKYDDAIGSFGNNLPSNEQWQELIDYCTWTAPEPHKYKISGPNGKFIFLSDIAPRDCDNNKTEYYVSGEGYMCFLDCRYWSSTQINSNKAYHFIISHLFTSGRESYHKNLTEESSCYRMAVRLVHNP